MALWLGAVPSHAAERRVALIRADHELLRQLSLALAAWDVRTLPLDVNAPASTQPQSLIDATDLAFRLKLDGVVWVSDSADGSLLWVYDAGTREITTRAIAERPPFSSATAAGLALSVKTTLRASVEPAALAERRAPPKPARTAPAMAQAFQPRPTLPRVEVRAAVAAQSVSATAQRAWIGLHNTLWLGGARRLGLGLRVGAGSEVPIDAPGFRGKLREVGFGPSIELRLLSSRHWLASALVGSALQIPMLDGTLTRDSVFVEAKRYNVSMDVGAALDLRLTPGLNLGVDLKLAYLVAYQRYLVEAQPVFSPWRLIPSGGAHVAVELY
jgi:hypothetical protein